MSHANTKPFSGGDLSGLVNITLNGFNANKNGVNQVGLVRGVNTKITFTTEVFDYNSEYDAANSRFTPKIAGTYLLNVGISLLGTTALDNIKPYIYKNGIMERSLGVVQITDALQIGIASSVILEANGTSDYFEVFAAIGVLSGTRDISGDIVKTYFSAKRLGP